MHRSVALPALGLLFVFGVRPPEARAQEPDDSVRLRQLERQVEAVTRELERLTLGPDVVEADSSVLGLGPGASKVYHVDRGVSLGGYGEVLYQNFAEEREDGSLARAADRVDALRAILYVGYKFDDRLLFNSEIEVEHTDEVGLEFAYVDYLFGRRFGARAGLLLAPLGLVNELHEPPVFLGSTRPVTETRIIPTTWRENGLGLFGGTDELAWKVYVMNSFDGTGFTGRGLRGGRQKGDEALAENLGVAGRLDYTGTPGLLLGASAFIGGSGQGATVDGATVDGRALIWDLHADYRAHGLDLRGLVAGAHVDDVTALSALAGRSGSDAVGREMLGWYLQAGYDLLHGRRTEDQLLPYVRYEEVDTQRKVAAGFSSDPANDLSVLSLGAAWKPASRVVAKLDYQIHSDGADTGLNQWNVVLGWLF